MIAYLCDTCKKSLSPAEGMTTDGRTFHREWTRCAWNSGWVVMRAKRCRGYEDRKVTR